MAELVASAEVAVPGEDPRALLGARSDAFEVVMPGTAVQLAFVARPVAAEGAEAEAAADGEEEVVQLDEVKEEADLLLYSSLLVLVVLRRSRRFQAPPLRPFQAPLPCHYQPYPAHRQKAAAAAAAAAGLLT